MALSPERDIWKQVIGYEVWMLGETLKMTASISAPISIARPLLNVISESRVLHARNLCDFCYRPLDKNGKPAWKKTDIKPSDLFENYDEAPKYKILRCLVDGVATVYTTDGCEVEMSDGSTQLHSPKWAFDKKLAHPTQERGLSFDYAPFMNVVVPKLRLVVDEIGNLERAHGRNFPTLA